MRLKSKPAVAAFAACAFFLLTLGCSGGPEFNPLPPDSGSPTATSVPSETVTATVTPMPTEATRVFGISSPGTDLNGYLFRVFTNLTRYDAISLASQFYTSDGGAEGVPESSQEVLVRIEGEYSVPFVDPHSDGGFILSP